MTTTRTRKAWSVTFRGYDPHIYYAPTASQARAAAISGILDVRDCTFAEALSELSACRRDESADVRLPERHPLAPHLPAEVLHCVVHAFGGRGLKAGYRDHFYTGANDWALLAGLYHGLFSVYRRDRGQRGRPDMVMYMLTDLGRNVASGEVMTYPAAGQ